MNKILFLDVDGVCNSRRWLRTLVSAEEAERMRSLSPVYLTDEERFERRLDPNAMLLLNDLFLKVGGVDLKVVITSTYRRLFGTGFMAGAFNRCGFKFSKRIIGKTPSYNDLDRGSEIECWYSENLYRAPVPPFVIFDDQDILGHLTGHLIRTDIEIGLQSEHVEKALEVLKGS